MMTATNHLRVSEQSMSDNEPQPDVLVEARELGPRINAAIKRITDGHGAMRIPADKTDPDIVLSEVQQLITRLCDEVERLREQWNTRFNTLCGLCGHRYHGPRDDDKHGYGKCDVELAKQIKEMK